MHTIIFLIFLNKKVSKKQPWIYRMRILCFQSLRSEHILMSVFTRPPNSTFTRCQRLACGSYNSSYNLELTDTSVIMLYDLININLLNHIF